MITQNTIEITNVIDLSVPYLTRFFSKSGEIEKVVKDEQKKLVFIVNYQLMKEFKNKRSIEKALAFNGRVMDKKPINIKKFNQLNLNKQKIAGYKEKQKVNLQKLPLLKLPSFHQLSKQELKLKRSSYKLIIEQKAEEHCLLLLESNPFESITNKSELWHLILNDMKESMKQNKDSQYQLIMSISMGIWAYIQLKLRQIEYLLMHKQNMKSKYIENFIQETVVNKITLLSNDKLITNPNRFKVQQQHQGLLFAFDVPYPEQTEQEAQFFSQTNQTVHKFLISVYQHSQRLGKICHILHTNSLIVYEDTKSLQKMIKQFLSKPSKQLLRESQPKVQKIEHCENQQKQSLNEQSQSLSSFTGQIEHYGSCIFQNLTHNGLNSLVWLQNFLKNLEIRQEDYPQFFTSSYRFDQCKGKSLNEQSFFNIYVFDEKEQIMTKKQSYTFADQALVFEEGQFSLSDLVQNSLSFIRFRTRSQISDKEQGRLLSCKIQQYILHNRFHNSTLKDCQCYNNSQSLNSPIDSDENRQQKTKISLNFDIFYVGIQILSKHQEIKNSYHLIKKCSQKLSSKFNTYFSEFQVSINFNLIMIEILPSKQSQLNAFKCENYLINHIDSHIIAKNTIIASQQFAQKVAEKVLQNADKNQLFGIKDKKYIGSQIWRLYNKSGARRAKLKISEYHFKRLKSE